MKGSEQNAGDESVPKKSAWDGYRRYTAISRFVFPILFCVAVFAGFVPTMFEKAAPIFVPVFILFALVSIPFQWFKCPQCDNFFFYLPGFFSFYRPSGKKCPHCGLPKWEEPSPKPPKAEIYPIPRSDHPPTDPAIAERLRLANFLTLVLHDDPKAIGLRLDASGWADVDLLLDRANRYGIKLTRENLAEVLSDSENPRFDWDRTANRIRACR